MPHHCFGTTAFVRAIFGTLIGFAGAYSQSASACFAPSPASEVVFYDLPPSLPVGVTILEVYFLPSGPLYPGESARPAYVRRVVQGSYAGRMIDVLVEGAQDGRCRLAVTSGKSGYVVGVIGTDESGKAQFRPIYEEVDDRLRRGGIQHPDPKPQEPVVRPFLIPYPSWVREPNEDDLERHRPPGAVPYRARWIGLSCSVTAEGSLTRCMVRDRLVPAAWGNAALRLAKIYTMKPNTLEGWRVEGGEVRPIIKYCAQSWTCDERHPSH